MLSSPKSSFFGRSLCCGVGEGGICVDSKELVGVDRTSCRLWSCCSLDCIARGDSFCGDAVGSCDGEAVVGRGA